TFQQLVRDTDQGGKVNSWFDHNLPTYNHNNNVQLWTGDIFNHTLTNPNLGCWDRRCYDGHNGIDFALASPATVRASATGTVVRVNNNCAAHSPGCGGGYGNYVVIYHSQIGYF